MKSSAIVIGGGVNELVATHYLARAGLDVTLLAERDASSEPSQTGWVPPHIVRDLELLRHGLDIRYAHPWALSVTEGARLELTADVHETAAAIAKLSRSDGQRWPQFCERMHALARVLEALYSSPPPDVMAESRRERLELAVTGLRLRRAGKQTVEDFLRLLSMPVADFLDDWFENDALKGVLGGAAVRHLRQGPRSGGTAFNLLHHHVGSPAGVFSPPVSNVRRVLTAQSRFQTRAGRVARIEVRQGRARSVVLSDGEELPATVLVSGEPPRRTLLELVDPGWLDPKLVRAIRNIRSRGAAARLSLTLHRTPPFERLVVAPSLDSLERAYDDVKYGRVSAEPYIEALHLPNAGTRPRVELHVQYVPHVLKEGVWDKSRHDALIRRVIACVSDAVPDFSSWVVDQELSTPEDLEHAEGWPEGQPCHAELALDQVLWMRPVPELSGYRTPIEGLYLCGPAMHPGGGIAGAAGANAAAVVLRDLKSASRRRR